MDKEIINTVSNASSSIDWSAWVTAFSSVILAFLTFVYVRLTKKILSSQSDPCVVVTVVHDENRSTILQIVAANIGTGLAHDIRFDFSQPIPAKAWGLATKNSKKAEIMNDGPLINGIPALAPGESRKIDWGQYGGLKASIGDSKITVTCRFKKNGKEMSPVICPLDVDSFTGTVASESPLSKISKELENISKNFGYLSSGFQKIKVDISSLPEKPSEEESV